MTNNLKIERTENYLIWREKRIGKTLQAYKIYRRKNVRQERLICNYKIKSLFEDKVLLRVVDIRNPYDLSQLTVKYHKMKLTNFSTI